MSLRQLIIRDVRRNTLISRAAFTLVETVSTIVILSVLSVTASGLIFAAWGAHDAVVTRASVSDQLNAAMERTAGELRNIDLQTTTATGPAISAMTASSITFTVNSSSRTISLSGTDLLLSGAAATSMVLASNVTAFSLQAYDKDNVALSTTPSAAVITTIRRIQITMTSTSGTATETLRTKVFVRSMASGSGAL